jgi:hypothetical protein
MPLSQAVLKAAIKTEMQAIAQITDDQALDKFCNALAKAIVQHITSNALVSVSVTGTVTAGIAAGSPVAGSGTGTVS